MSQDKIQITNAPPLPGTQLVQELNDAFEALATDFSGSVDPAAYAFAYSLWADTGTGNLKRRNAANNAWTTIGRIYPAAIEDASGNLGLGVTPSVWQSNWKAIEAYSGALASLSTGISFRIYSNGHINGFGVENYPRTGASSKIDLSDGGFAFFTAPSGTAGNAITFTSRLELRDSGLAGSFVTNNDGFQVCSSAAAGNTWANFIGRHSATSPLTGTISFIVRNNGNVINTNNSYGAISDLKLKENIVEATPKLDKLNQVRVVNYNIIGDTQKQLGVIAQELEQVFPGMVDETPDRDEEGNDLGTTTKSVKYSVFVPILIKAIQELKAEFDAYKAAHP